MTVESSYQVGYPLAPEQDLVEVFAGPGYQTRMFLQPPQVLIDYWRTCQVSKKSARSAI